MVMFIRDTNDFGLKLCSTMIAFRAVGVSDGFPTIETRKSPKL